MIHLNKKQHLYIDNFVIEKLNDNKMVTKKPQKTPLHLSVYVVKFTPQKTVYGIINKNVHTIIMKMMK
mgnify:CR=1 FL=1